MKKNEVNKWLKRKKNRRLEPKKIDFNYGENSDQPDMNKVTFEKSEEERKEIERRTVLRADYGEC